MSYTPPSGGAVDFTLTGVAYSAPSSSSVDFQWSNGIPTFTLVAKSTVGISAIGLFPSVATASCLSETQFESPYRQFAINCRSTPEFITWLRAPWFAGSSSFDMRSGSSATVSGDSAVSFTLVSVVQASPVIAGQSAFAANGISTYNSSYRSAGSSRLVIEKIYNLPMRMVVPSRSVLSLKKAAINRSVLGVFGAGTFNPNASSIKKAQFSSDCASAFSLSGEKLIAAGFSTPGTTTIMFSGLRANAGQFDSSAHTNIDMASSYFVGQASVDITDIDSVVVFTKTIPFTWSVYER